MQTSSKTSVAPRRRPCRRIAIPAIAAAIALLFGATSSGARAVDEDYRISAGDMIEFQIIEEPDTFIAQRVTLSGELPLPMIGVVKVAGLTLREAEVKLCDLYIAGNYFITPQVILIVQEYSDRSISILGEVAKPEQIPFPVESETLGIVRAITLAGGLTRTARADRIEITRRTPDGTEEHYTVNFRSFVSGRAQDRVRQFQLLPGDIVYVPERRF